MLLYQLFQWPVEDQLGNGWGLRTALEDAPLIMLRFPTDAFGLDGPRACIQVQSQFEVHHRVLQDPGRFDDVVQIDGVIEARQVSQTGHRVNAMVLGDFRFEHTAYGDREAILVGPRFVPGKFLVKSQLPSLQVILAVAIPDAIQT